MLGRVTEVTDPEKQTVRYSWTPAGERESITYPDGSMVRYGYDTAGRISQVTDGQEAAAAYRYDAVGHILERMLLNGIKTEYTYGELGMVESLIHSDQTGQLDAFSYIYDPAGNRTEVQRTRRLSGGMDETSASGYVYDSMNRLTEVSRDGALLRSYGYDALGNRTIMADAGSGAVTNYEYDLLNRLIRQSGADGEQAFRYDRRGNLASVSQDGAFQKSFRFDAANRMVSAATASGDTAAYTYDGLGRRIKSVWDKAGDEAGHEEKRYVLDALKPYENILMVYGAENAARHVWGNELLSTGAIGIDPAYYLNDELRSPVRITNMGGESLSCFDYDEFGVPTSRKPIGPENNVKPFGANLFEYTGYQPDPVTDLYYAQARYYMPQTGRFVSEDPIRSGSNWYTYCDNNPVNFIDPSGNTPCDAEAYMKTHIRPKYDKNNEKQWSDDLAKWYDGYWAAFNKLDMSNVKVDNRVNINLVDPRLLTKATAMANYYNVKIEITGGYRSSVDQAAMRAQWDQGNHTGLVTQPAAAGRSWHNWGGAIDMTYSSPKLNDKVFKQFGLVRPDPKGDSVHFQILADNPTMTCNPTLGSEYAAKYVPGIPLK